MPKGRPSLFQVDVGSAEFPWARVLLVTGDDRLTLPVEASRHKKWLAPNSELLAILGKHLIEITPLQPALSDLQARIGEIQNADERRQGIRIARGRYARLAVNVDRRIRLPPDFRVVLEAPSEGAYFVRMGMDVDGPVTLRPANAKDYDNFEEEASALGLL